MLWLANSSSPVEPVTITSSSWSALGLYSDTAFDGFAFQGTNGYAAYIDSGTAGFINCLFSGNIGGSQAGAIYADYSTKVSLIHCTLIGNSAHDDSSSGGNAIYANWDATLIIRNSILWNPSANNSFPEIEAHYATVSAANSIIRGGQYGGIDQAPGLVSSGWMTANSPARQVGAAGWSARDIHGETRPTTSAPDLGWDQLIDLDTDGLPDWWELEYFGGIATQDGQADSDSDGLSNIDEYGLGTTPALADTDGDGLSDGDEVAAGTNPFNVDTDADGMPDGWESQNGLNPTDASDTLADADGDRIPNLWEYIHGTEADNAQSSPAPTQTVAATGGSHTTLQAAYNAAGDFAVISVSGGTYTGQLSASGTKRVLWLGQLSGSNGPAILSRNANSDTVALYATTVMDGFVFTHAANNTGRGLFLGKYWNLADTPRIRISNSLIKGNTASTGAAFYNQNTMLELVHCTVIENTATGTDALIYNEQPTASTRIINSIVWNAGQTALELRDGGYQYSVVSSIIRGGQLGGIDLPPALAYGGLLTANSPARQSGAPGRSASDIHGETRPANPAPDLGWDQFVDADSDNLPDWWEIKHFGNLPAQSGLGDADGDGASNSAEYAAGTNPSLADTDADGLSDSDEAVAGTDPFNPDSDGDGMPDGWEWQHGLNPLDASDALSDFDNDDFPNVFEYHHGSDPTDAGIKPEFSTTQTGTSKYYRVDSGLPTNTPFEKKTVAAAISAANNFDIIEVRPGMYPETLTLNKRLYLFSTEGARNTILDGTGKTTSIVNITAESVVSGFTIRNLNRRTVTSANGGGISVNVTGTQNRPRIIACVIAQNSVGNRGGGVYIQNGSPTFVSCTIADNYAPQGSGIYNLSTNNSVPLHNTLLWNTPGDGLDLAGQTTAFINNRVLSRDPATGHVHIDGVSVGTANPGLGFGWSLTASSPARNAGNLLLVSPRDMDGEPRSEGAAPDIGADEFHDSDADGLPNWLEALGITAPNADHDGDGLSNLAEYETHRTDPRLTDTDGDGLSDGDEVSESTDPTRTDSDFDGLPDSWEVLHGLNPSNPADAATDPDNDGYTNLEEFQLGKNPNLAEDTDNDGIPDGKERFLIYRTPSGGWGYFNLNNPDTDNNGINDGLEDYDRDGLTVLQEITLGTNPNLSDTDGDGVADGVEVVLGTNPLVADPWTNRDSDGDGLDDFTEITIGTNPFNADTNGNGMPDGEELNNGGDPANPGPPPTPLPPPSPNPEPPGDPSPTPPPAITPGEYDILVETKSVSFPKYGHPTFQVLDPPKRFLVMTASQTYAGSDGKVESGPLGINGSQTWTIDPLTGVSTPSGDSYVSSFGNPASPLRKSGTRQQYGYDDPPNQEGDGTATINGVTTLKTENTTAMMVSNGKSKLEAFTNDLQPGTPFAYRNVHENELAFDYQKVQFKFQWKDGVTEEQKHPVTYLVVFRPEDDPDTENIDESLENAEIVETITWDGETSPSAVFAIDPDSKKAGVDGTYSLIYASIEVRKQGQSNAPAMGLLAKVGEVIEFAIAPDLFDVEDIFEDVISWQFRQLKSDGTYTAWSGFGANGTGTTFEHTTSAAGIFQVKAVLQSVGEILHLRKTTDPYTSGSALLKRDDPDSIGIVDTQTQIDIVNAARADLGSTAYAANVANGCFEAGTNKCNLFVAEKAQVAGATVPYINFEWLPLPPHPLPPVANQWAGIPPDSQGTQPAYTITGWTLLADDAYPQPGLIVASGWEETWATGHAGITDYDGRWISAGPSNVNRNADFLEYRIHTYPSGLRPAGKRKYNGN